MELVIYTFMWLILKLVTCVAAPLFEEDSLPAGTQPKTATYEELRRRNREEYELKKTKQFRYVIVWL